ncbi:uncharacterized protein CC84DRAFT_1160465 [Paraphaeosphaeria sporulosa]|uniref:Uncharacterized protein n=1 Tax=Paraphaeosphaeria sporulosa TaxID=1460663 RepID=A0A177CP20_9PLEO|nr:uncharacterized protein CC84DRAFT_1160465 [Paraphaeosphaeria sporulosa]OAG09275.1 hypothetical protein CC84DRAFT_1160465 [Paraphaeosphaeria sporulosa]
MGVHHHQHLQTIDSKDTASKAITRAYSQTYQTYQYHLLLVAFVASLYGLYYQISNVYREYATRHSKHHHQPDMCFSSSIPSTASSSVLASSGTNYNKSIFLPYVHKFGTRGVPLVWVTIHSGKEDVRIDMPVDTGSTGLLIGAPLLPGVDPRAGTPGRQYLSSSNIVYVGRYLDLNLTFHGTGNISAGARVPILIVDKSWVCPWYDSLKHGFECPLGPEGQEPVERDVSGITYMGVGFGRNKNAEGQRTATSWGNPFLNINSINGTRFEPEDMKAGYIVSTKGIQLGLTRENTRGYDFMKLERGIAHAVDARDWAMPRMQFRVNGRKSIPGSALIDTGRCSRMCTAAVF